MYACPCNNNKTHVDEKTNCWSALAIEHKHNIRPSDAEARRACRIRKHSRP